MLEKCLWELFDIFMQKQPVLVGNGMIREMADDCGDWCSGTCKGRCESDCTGSCRVTCLANQANVPGNNNSGGW